MENQIVKTGSKAVGLVFSGGGAKGAYQAGVLKALAELKIEVDAVSGASIGALNGAVLASAGSVVEGAARLEELWKTLAEAPPLEGEVPSFVRILEEKGLPVQPFLRNSSILARQAVQNLIPTIRSPKNGGLIDNGPIKKLLGQYVSHEKLAQGLPVYVSVFPNLNFWESAVGFSLAFLKIQDTRRSEFIHLQALNADEQEKILLASAALPFLLQSQEVQGTHYSDGGQGGWLTSQGNTPIAPLVERGYGTVIVASLSDRARWERQDSSDTKIIEIERRRTIDRTPILPEVFDTLSFHPERIASWIEQGYEDTMRSLLHGNRL